MRTSEIDLLRLAMGRNRSLYVPRDGRRAAPQNARTTMRTTSQNTQTTKKVSQAASRYGSPEPQIEIRPPKSTNHRLVSAALHKLAAEVELATPERERWVVQTESFYDARGRVYLELADATPAVAERGLAMLRKLVG